MAKKSIIRYITVATLALASTLLLATGAGARTIKSQGVPTRSSICFAWNLYCHTYVDAWTPVYPSPSRNWTNPIIWEPAPTRVEMKCWLDNQGERWFFVQEYRQGSFGYVQAWHTHNQIGVGHC